MKPPSQSHSSAHGGFWRFWSVEVATDIGIGLAFIAFQTIIVLDLGGGATEVGWLQSARWLPYVILGLLVGALVEGYRRRTVMILSDLMRALLLIGIGLLWLAGVGSIWALLAAVLLLGTASLFNDSASQAFVPRLVARDVLLRAHQRLDAGANAAQSAGPALSGVVIAWLGAPISLLAAGFAHLVSVFTLLTLRVDEPLSQRPSRLGSSMMAGLRFVHRHPRLGPFARWTHAWFLCNGAAMTLLAPLVLLDLEAGPAGLGIAFGVLGGATLTGTLSAGFIAGRLGLAGTIIAERATMPFAWGSIALAGLLPLPKPASLVLLFAGLVLLGIVMGMSNPSEMALRQQATPDRMQARMNATMRTVNRSMIVVSAPLAGVLGDAIGFGAALAVVCGGFAVAAIGLAASSFARR